jgi:acyl transferase domain-containing protein
MSFPPVAIVGQSCLLPGARDPEELWTAVHEGRDLLSPAPPGRWGIGPRLGFVEPSGDGVDGAWSDKGGYVEGFEALFDPAGFRVAAEEILPLDPLFHWVLHTARQALRSAGHDAAHDSPRAGLVLGNLSFPTSSLARFAEAVWLEGWNVEAPARPDPRNRFMSGLPALLAARALGLGAGAFALDAACASSLYALKLACDRLHDGTADLMLAAAVNRADDLFIHVGFTALKALSRTGRSRPFHREADGLVPAEGAAAVVLKRLPDAIAAGDRILGVIRGIGLSNDGRGSGFLAPAEEGQRRAMQRAYEMAGLRPADVSLLECHATGTSVGDATEIRSTAAVYEGLRDVPIGSIKSNLGHLITVAGLAGVLKITAAMRKGIRPPTLHADDPLPLIAESPFRLLHRAEPWTDDAAPRRAAVSAFGFGGNNAHVLIEQWTGPERITVPAAGAAPPRGDVAIVGIGSVVADLDSKEAFAGALFEGRSRVRPGPDGTEAASTEEVALAAAGLRFPPRDLAQALPQQILALAAAREAIAEAGVLPRERTAVVVGMGCDAEVARYGARWRVGRRARGGGEGRVETSRRLGPVADAFVSALDAPGVVGTMPNICANRLNSQFDLAGPSLTVSAEEASGLVAITLACRALRAGEIDAAVVGASEVASTAAHAEATRASLPAERRTPGDAAVVLVLKRLEDAQREGLTVYAVIADEDEGASLRFAPEPAGSSADGLPLFSLTGLFGHAHAASGLLHAAAAALACRHAARPMGEGQPPRPWLPPSRARGAVVETTTLAGGRARLRLGPGPGPSAPWTSEPLPRLHVYSGADRAEVLAALREGRESGAGPARLVVLAADESERRERAARARTLLADPGATPDDLGEGLAFREQPLGGETGFVFTGPAGAYAGMGRDLLLAFPQILEPVAGHFARMSDVAGWVYGAPEDHAALPAQKLWGSSLLCQAHAELTRGLLGMAPQAAIGFCSGETNALYALSAWSDVDAMVADIEAAAVYETELAGRFDAVRRAWNEPASSAVAWQSWRVLAPLDQVRAALKDEPRAHLTIVNAPGDCVIGGDPAACERVVARLGPQRARPLGYDIAVHCPEMSAFAGTWRHIHDRPTEAVPGVRFYTGATGDHYALTREAAADALLGMASHTVDFPRVVEKSWQDGVRVFLEHGPHGGCSRWIDRILGDRPHLAVPLDLPGVSSVRQAAQALAQIIAAGVSVNHEAWNAAVARAEAASGLRAFSAEAQTGAIRFKVARARPARPAPPMTQSALPATAARAVAEALPVEGVEVMAAAPSLPSVLGVAEEVPEPVPVGAVAGSSRPAAASATTNAAPSAPPGSMLARLAAGQAQLARIHRQFLADQAEAHQRFLALSSRIAGPGAAASPAPRTASSAAVAVPSTAAPDSRRATSAIAPPAAPLVAEVVTHPPAPTRPDGAASAGADAAAAPEPPTGPRFSRQDLEVHASGRISSIFGPLFDRQDGFERQVRMPEPPLLLADRVTGIRGEPGGLGLGTVWTETDVPPDAWYLHDGRMPAGIMIESGQADLFLISWLGIDFHNRGGRVYRLLGCELTYHGGLPRPGDTLRYDIHVDGHARQGDVRLFFFHYDCRAGGAVRLSVRGGQAGFFTDAELAETAGVLWSATDETPEPARVDAPAVPRVPRRFDLDAVRAFSEGRAARCFGDGFERADTHVQTPRIAGGKLLLMGEVPVLDPHGGPWGRGYLRSMRRLAPGDWFFEGHFKNDPCMPGTLMFEGCLQTMAFYLAALGFTLDHDGWRFEPVPDETYQLRCRGQATPTSRELVYEVFVRELHAGPEPTLYADLLCTVDGVKAFHCRRMGLRLVPDWPLARRADALAAHVPSPLAARTAGVTLDYPALLGCAWGRPSEALGPVYAPFDGPRRLPRLPGPPYHFMTRVRALSGEIGALGPGASVEVDYDVPRDAWYFAENGAHGAMPFSVLLEVALQPCGWLALGTGLPLRSAEPLHFRNLDGDLTALREVHPDTGTLTTRVRLLDVSRSGGMSLVFFQVETLASGEPVLQLTTSFGFFPGEALAQQVGLPPTGEERAWLDRPTEAALDLVGLRERAAGLPRERLALVDRITGAWPKAGRAGMGRLRAEKDVRASDWFFKAHFYQDPVQPGSLGLEALVELLKCHLVSAYGGAEVSADARFEALALATPLRWKYRGQVVPRNRVVTLELEVLESARDAQGARATADGWLWVDGLRIYAAQGLSARLLFQP